MPRRTTMVEIDVIDVPDPEYVNEPRRRKRKPKTRQAEKARQTETPTPTMRRALVLARDGGGLRWVNNAWIRRDSTTATRRDGHANNYTKLACETRGWLARANERQGHFDDTWIITDAGRAAIDAEATGE
jgi:hypothetical protein